MDFEVDGFGTLILPTGTYENVLRYHFFRTQVGDTGFVTITQTKEQCGWMSSDHRFWLMIQEINNDGFSDSELIWYDKDPLPALVTSQEEQAQLTIELYPNPTVVGQVLNLKWDHNESAQLSITALSGQQIINERVNLHNGFNPFDLSGRIAAEGIYIVQIATARGLATSKLVVRN